MNDLLPLPSRNTPKWRMFDVAKLVQEVCLSLAPQLEAQRIEIQIDVPSGTTAGADCDLLRRALVNLIHHAAAAMPAGGELTVTAWHSAGALELEVADSGPGIEPCPRKGAEERISENRREAESELSAVYRVAESHRGDVTVANCPQGGSAVTLRIPQRGLKRVA